MVDLLLGADVDAPRRLVEDQDVAVLDQPLRDNDLLLVAAGEELGRLTDGGCLDAQARAVIIPPRASSFGAGVIQPLIVC